jgi:hypothetical protein
MNRLALLTVLNVVTCDCCQWQRCHDIADGLASGDIIANADVDAIVGLHMSPSGAALLRHHSIMPDAAA